MNLPAALFSPYWHLTAIMIALAVFWWLARSVPWQSVCSSVQLHVTLGFSVALMFFWSLKAGVEPGLNLHMLGAMPVTLAVGPALAMVSLGLAMIGVTINGAIEWQSLPINFLFMVVVPVLIANALKNLVEKILPAHFFIFIFIVAFIGAGVTVILQGGVASLGMVLSGAYSADYLLSNYLPYFLLLGFSEAWMSGAVITLLVVYRPTWISGFDDERYLGK